MYLFIYMYTCIIHIYICKFTYLLNSIYMCMYIIIYVCACACMCVCVCVRYMCVYV